MREYRHSESFSQLKSVKEQINTNLSTVQYMRILDAFVHKALEPLVANTHYVDVVLAEVLSWSIINFRRKVSMLGRDHLTPNILAFLIDTDLESRKERLLGLKLDRGVHFHILQTFLETIEQKYLPAADCELEMPAGYCGDTIAYCKLQMQDIEKGLGCTKGPLLTTYHRVRYWYDHAIEFKHKILEKYTRLCLVNAQRDYSFYFNREIELDDITQMYLYVASRAIDKCDSDQGALTSHIQNWFKTGRSQLNKERVTASSLSLDDEESFLDLGEIDDHHSEDHERTKHLLTLARIADPYGLGRYLLGLNPELPEASRNVLRSLAAGS